MKSLILSFITSLSILNATDLKVLHLTFHRGCESEIEAISHELKWDLTTWFIPDLEPYFLDGYSKGNTLYNIGHVRADKIWQRHEFFFNSFDLIITSDTVPLSRIFLQNNWSKPLIIWICNRIDYADQASLDCDFPDDEYYSLLKQASKLENVKFIAYNEFEHYYAKLKKVDTGHLTIKPIALNLSRKEGSSIPSQIDKPSFFFLPPYHNETIFMNLSETLSQIGIQNYCGRYNGAFDLADFQGIIHLPYAWSNLALFENVSLGIPYFIPSSRFFSDLARSGNYFHPSLNCLLDEDQYHLSEWYNPENQDFFIFFDSWEDLKNKIDNTDFPSARKKVFSHYLLHRKKMINRWKKILKHLI